MRSGQWFAPLPGAVGTGAAPFTAAGGWEPFVVAAISPPGAAAGTGGFVRALEIDGVRHRRRLDRKLEIRADARLAFQPDRAAEHLAKAVADRQTQPRTAVLAAGRGVHLAESPEEPVQLFLGNPLPRVAHGEMEHPRVNRADVPVVFHLFTDLMAGDDHVHAPARGGELHRVGDQIEKNLPDARDIADEDLGDARIDLAGQRQPLADRLHREQVDDFLQAGPQVERLVVQLQAARLDLGEIQGVVDEAQEIVAAGGD